MEKAIIYDIETLSQDQYRGVLVNIAVLKFDMKRVKFGAGIGGSYTYEELLGLTHLIKFDVNQQVKEYDRKIQPETLKWWKEQSPAAQSLLVPSKEDRDLKELYPMLLDYVGNMEPVAAYTRNNTFDPVYVQFACKQFGHPMPHKWWITRDIKSTIDGMTWGEDIKDSFIPEGLESKFIAHDPRHDIVMDVMRLQFLSRILIDTIPF